MHISSSLAKILGGKLFRIREFLRSGSKAKDGERETKEKEKRAKISNNDGQLRIAMPPRVSHAKPPGPKNMKGGCMIPSLVKILKILLVLVY